MNSSDIISQRLHNQKLSAPEFRQPVEVVRWFGAVQAQDFNAAKWALALRMRRATNASIEAAYNEGRILRTHVMRPTWHFVAPDDIRWLLPLTAPRVNLRCGPNYRKYELDATVFKRSNRVLTNALKGGKHLTRAALKTVLNRAGVDADNTIRLAHIFLRAELDGVVCSGPMLGKQFTYALLEERVPETKSLTRDEALAKLTRRYFTSHGPATLQDFVWWSGLTAADAKHGIALVHSDLKEALLEEKSYWSAPTKRTRATPQSAHLLPAFDEYSVAYKDRQRLFEFDHPKSLTTPMGLLGPTVLVDGKVVGAWNRTSDKGTITLNLARSLKKPERLAVAQAAERYAEFLGESNPVVHVLASPVAETTLP